MTSWARIQYERKQINKVLVRCKNGVHQKNRRRLMERDEKRLQERANG